MLGFVSSHLQVGKLFFPTSVEESFSAQSLSACKSCKVPSPSSSKIPLKQSQKRTEQLGGGGGYLRVFAKAMNSFSFGKAEGWRQE